MGSSINSPLIASQWHHHMGSSQPLTSQTPASPLNNTEVCVDWLSAELNSVTTLNSQPVLIQSQDSSFTIREDLVPQEKQIIHTCLKVLNASVWRIIKNTQTVSSNASEENTYCFMTCQTWSFFKVATHRVEHRHTAVCWNKCILSTYFVGWFLARLKHSVPRR